MLRVKCNKELNWIHEAFLERFLNDWFCQFALDLTNLEWTGKFPTKLYRAANWKTVTRQLFWPTGKEADFVVLDTDIFADGVSSADIASTRVLLTVLAGKEVFRCVARWQIFAVRRARFRKIKLAVGSFAVLGILKTYFQAQNNHKT